MNVRIAMSLLVLSAPIAASAAEPATPALGFSWPDMTCGVKQRLDRQNTKPIESEYTMSARRSGENLRVSFLGFRVLDTFPEVPARARAKFLEAEYAVGRLAVERVFDVTSSGTFVRAESPADVQARVKASGKPSPLFMTDNQARLDAKYLRWWSDFLGDWIGLALTPGTTQVKLAHRGDEYWLNYDVPTEVTVSAPVDCLRGALRVRCVTIRAHFTPAYNKPGESDVNSTRHEDNSEIVLEPDTMLPHSWMNETRYRGGSLDGNLQNRYTRTFECIAGS